MEAGTPPRVPAFGVSPQTRGVPVFPCYVTLGTIG